MLHARGGAVLHATKDHTEAQEALDLEVRPGVPRYTAEQVVQAGGGLGWSLATNVIRIRGGQAYRDCSGRRCEPAVSPPFEIREGDWLLIASDGLFLPPVAGRKYASEVAVSNERVAALLKRCDTPSQALIKLQELIGALRKRGGKDDNLTVLLFRADWK